MMIDKRIEHYQKENARLFKLLIDEKLLQKQDVIIKTINEHEAVIRELKHIKKLSLGNVSKRYLIEVHTDKGNSLHTSIIHDRHQAKCIYEQTKRDYKGYKVTKIEIPSVC